MEDFIKFEKIGRLSRNCIITEKIDGTNAQIMITEDGEFLTGSRNRWVTPEDDNYGFSRWAHEHKDELMKLGVGRHYGEWWGGKIQRHYNIKEKRFSLFNTSIWNEETLPKCCYVVPKLYEGKFRTYDIISILGHLDHTGSIASPGFMMPEGIIIFHEGSQTYFKKTFKNDDQGKRNNN